MLIIRGWHRLHAFCYALLPVTGLFCYRFNLFFFIYKFYTDLFVVLNSVFCLFTLQACRTSINPSIHPSIHQFSIPIYSQGSGSQKQWTQAARLPYVFTTVYLTDIRCDFLSQLILVSHTAVGLVSDFYKQKNTITKLPPFLVRNKTFMCR